MGGGGGGGGGIKEEKFIKESFGGKIAAWPMKTCLSTPLKTYLPHLRSLQLEGVRPEQCIKVGLPKSIG